uniref:Uncharacterized protein n=1 Tax=Glossina pallidipes TaxID=7398 RepID=A0A1A9ZIV6_GLOPL
MLTSRDIKENYCKFHSIKFNIRRHYALAGSNTHIVYLKAYATVTSLKSLMRRTMCNNADDDDDDDDDDDIFCFEFESKKYCDHQVSRTAEAFVWLFGKQFQLRFQSCTSSSITAVIYEFRTMKNFSASYEGPSKNKYQYGCDRPMFPI